MGGRVRYLLVLIASLFLVGAADAQDLNREKFRNYYVGRLLAAEPDAVVRLDPDDPAVLHITRPGEEEPYAAFLDNPYRDYLATPEAIEEIVDHHARIALGRTPDFGAELTPDRLVVLVRPASMMLEPFAADIIRRPFAGDLVEVLVIDGQDTIGYANKDTLEKLGLDRDAAFALAHKNLFVRMGPVDTGVESGITVTGAVSGLATGLLVAPGFCAEGNEDVFVIVPDKNSFWSVPASDTRTVELLRRVLRGMVRRRETMSETIIECRGGVWR